MKVDQGKGKSEVSIVGEGAGMHVWGCGQCACVILHTSGFSYSGRG